MICVNSAPLTLPAVEKLTGLSREVLRKWELRYHFPQPVRGERGERRYSFADVHRLQLVGQLIACGMRPGRLVPLSVAQLQALLAARDSVAPPLPDALGLPQQVQSLLTRLSPATDAGALTQWFESLLAQSGLAWFVANLLPAFNQAVGDAWQAGRLGVHAEHLYTETLRQVVTSAVPTAAGKAALPRILLTTPPTELHSLGLLALHAQLRLCGADAINLGTEMPVAEVLAAVQGLQAAVVAVSVSACLDGQLAMAYLQTLRRALPAGCALWLGGQGCVALSNELRQDCEVFVDTPSAVLRWQQMVSAALAST